MLRWWNNFILSNLKWHEIWRYGIIWKQKLAKCGHKTAVFSKHQTVFFWGGDAHLGIIGSPIRNKLTQRVCMAFQIGPLEPSRSGPSKAMGFWENEIRPLLFFCGAKNGIFPRLFMVFFVADYSSFKGRVNLEISSIWNLKSFFGRRSKGNLRCTLSFGWCFGDLFFGSIF